MGERLVQVVIAAAVEPVEEADGGSRPVQRLLLIAVLSMMTSPASWRQLTQRAGWTFDESEAWLTASLAQLLLKPDP